MAKDLVFPEYAPDITNLGTGKSLTISGVVPQADGYGPFPLAQAFTQMLGAPCRGYFFARRSDGSIAVFAGTSTRLYILDNSSFAFTDVSKGGAAYSALVSTANWRFAQYNDLVIAVQSNTVPQKFVLSSATAFVDLGGSPPQASNIAVINRFILLTGLLVNPRRVAWCDLDAPETWTAGVGLADFQDLPDGGSVLGVSGGDQFGCVFQNERIRSLVYAPGSSVTFQITLISTQDTLFGEYSIITAGNKTYFCSAQGFKVIENGGAPQPIGKERVDSTFFADVDKSNLQLMIGATDPTSTRVYWAYKSLAGAANAFDKVLCFDPAIGENGRWSILPISGQYLASLARPGLTLEQLDGIAPTPIAITGAANNGAGKVRLTVAALSNASFSLGAIGAPSMNTVTVYGVVGTTEANVTAPYTVVDATHIDLPSVNFVNAYVSGGQVGGSLDAFPVSLDSISKSAVAALSIMTTNGALGFFTGANMEAILETAEEDLQGSLIMLAGVRPMTDSPDMLVSIGGRLTAQAAPSYTAEAAIIAENGLSPCLIETRYAKARARIPSGSTWTYARSIQPEEASMAGER